MARDPLHRSCNSQTAGLSLQQPGDGFDQEADRAAEQVMRMKAPLCSDSVDVVAADPGQVAAGRTSRQGQALETATREFFESRFGHDFADVRVHLGPDADESARSLQARAYTTGRDITFASGEYRPRDNDGRHLLAHELAHVVQQSRARRNTRSHTVAASLSRLPSQQVQRKFVATGEAADFVSLVNSILAVQHEVRVSAAGEVSIHSTTIQGPPTRDAQELLNVIRGVISNSKTTTIEFIRGAGSSRAGDENVIVGNYRLSRVDLDDVEAFGLQSSHSRMGDNAAVQLVHEITEQFRKQVHGEDFPTAHRAGYAAQERVLGARLVSETPMTPVGGSLGEVTTTYRYPDGREVDVITRMDFRTGQIVSVRRVVR